MENGPGMNPVLPEASGWGKLKSFWFSKKGNDYSEGLWHRDLHGLMVTGHSHKLLWLSGTISLLALCLNCISYAVQPGLFCMMIGALLGMLFSQYLISKAESSIVGFQYRYQRKPRQRSIIVTTFLSLLGGVFIYRYDYLPTWVENGYLLVTILAGSFIFSSYLLYSRWLLHYEADHHLTLVFYNILRNSKKNESGKP